MKFNISGSIVITSDTFNVYIENIIVDTHTLIFGLLF